VDPVLEVDWAAHWRDLVLSRAAGRGDPHSHGQEGYWDRRARTFDAWRRAQRELVMDFLGPWLSPRRTLIDVGAGTGVLAAQLAARLDWVTAVEPSQGMRDQIPEAANLTVIGSTWEDAEPAPADLVVCAHVIYGVAEPVPFIEKLERHARERVFVVLRDSPHPHPAERMSTATRSRAPRLRDCFLLLRQIGVAPDVTLFQYAASFTFQSLQAAVEECEARLGDQWEETAGRPWLKANLERRPDGTLVYDAGEMTAGVLHWKPRT
jgi:SAM-dependent methyltransferase